jgi:hypothetical protein
LEGVGGGRQGIISNFFVNAGIFASGTGQGLKVLIAMIPSILICETGQVGCTGSREHVASEVVPIIPTHRRSICGAISHGST